MAKKSLEERITGFLEKDKSKEAKNLCSIDCKFFGGEKAFSLKKCVKCLEVMQGLCHAECLANGMEFEEVDVVEEKKELTKKEKLVLSRKEKKEEAAKKKLALKEKKAVQKAEKTAEKEKAKEGKVKNVQPYDKVIKGLLNKVSNKDIAVMIVGEVPTPASFVGKCSCIFGVITGKSKSTGVIYSGVKELEAGKVLTKSGSSGYIQKVWDSYKKLKK